jgi:hypothetical protein
LFPLGSYLLIALLAAIFLPVASRPQQSQPEEARTATDDFLRHPHRTQ